MIKRITNKHIKIAGGVCAGIAYQMQVPAWAVRAATVLATFITGFFPILFVYFLAWILLPQLNLSESEFNKVTRPSKKQKDEVDFNNLYSEMSPKEKDKEVNG